METLFPEERVLLAKFSELTGMEIKDMGELDLEKASEIEIKLISVVADEVGFKIDGGSFSLEGIRKVEDDFEAKEKSRSTRTKR